MATSLPDRPAHVQRQPSQQELEIAQHLIEHSQGHHQQRPPPQPSATFRAYNEIPRSGEHLPTQTTPEHHDLNDTPQQYAPQPPSPSPSSQQPTTASPGPSTVPSGGQQCSNCGTTKTPLWRRAPSGAVICNACGLYYKARNQMRPVGLKRGSAAASSTHPHAHERSSSPTSLQGNATYITADQSTNGTCPGGGRCNGTGGHQGCNGCPAYNNRISKTAQVALSHPVSHHSPNPNTHSSVGGVSTSSVVVACQNCGTTITPLWRRDEAGHTICNACGLYYKLHAAHRPVGMKKAEIKRRKRVVPADMLGSSTDHDTHMSGGVSVPPSEEYEGPAQPHPVGGPIPVDFTEAFRSRYAPPSTTTTNAITPSSSSSGRLDVPPYRKRSFSTSERGEDSSMVEEDEMDRNIDPLLSETTTRAKPQASPGPKREDRRLALQREAEKMRELLVAKERELAELGEEG